MITDKGIIFNELISTEICAREKPGSAMCLLCNVSEPLNFKLITISVQIRIKKSFYEELLDLNKIRDKLKH